MSYEGYYQFLCPEGHYWTSDCYSEDKICHCGKEAIWENSVDITNGSFEGEIRIDGYIALKQIYEKKCDKCGSILEMKYEIPKEAR